MIDYDNIDGWEASLDAVLRPLIPRSIRREVVNAAPKYIEDALDLVLRLASRDRIIDATLTWLSSTHIAGYHGSRLTDTEVDSVWSDGLVPLQAEARRTRLIRALSPHPRYQEVAHNLDMIIHAHGQGEAGGKREGQVHLTLSRAGLTDSFNRYLTYGAEFDQCVARALLDEEGIELLACDAKARLIRIAVPGETALNASHPFFSIDDLRARGDLPNIVRQFLEVWSYRLVDASFQPRTIRVDCGMMFRSTVPAAWIAGIDLWAPSDT